MQARAQLFDLLLLLRMLIAYCYSNNNEQWIEQHPILSQRLSLYSHTHKRTHASVKPPPHHHHHTHTHMSAHTPQAARLQQALECVLHQACTAVNAERRGDFTSAWDAYQQVLFVLLRCVAVSDRSGRACRCLRHARLHDIRILLLIICTQRTAATTRSLCQCV